GRRSGISLRRHCRPLSGVTLYPDGAPAVAARRVAGGAGVGDGVARGKVTPRLEPPEPGRGDRRIMPCRPGAGRFSRASCAGPGDGAMLGFIVALFFLVGSFVVLPLIFLGVLLRLVVGIALLPFKILAAAVGLAFGVAGAIFGLIVAAFAIVIALLVVGLVVAIPFLPILLIGAAVYLLFRLTRPRVTLRPSV